MRGKERVELAAGPEAGWVTRRGGKKNVPATNDGLVGVVRVDVQPAADEDPRQNVAGRGDPLARRAANADGKVDSLHPSSPVRVRALRRQPARAILRWTQAILRRSTVSVKKCS